MEVPTLETVGLPASVAGTVGQVLTNKPEPIPIRQLPDDIGSLSFTSRSPLKLPGAPAYLAGSFLYRVDRSELYHGFFFPYEIQDPTAAQIQALDLPNRGLSPILMNIVHYINTPFKSNLRMKKVCSIDVKHL